MDTSSTVASWLSFAATAVGLGGLISQASAINDKMDPFHANRTAEYLGIWFQRQASFPWWRIAKPPPEGPVISAKLSEGFCGRNTLHLVRVPLRPAGKAGWAVILSIFHSDQPPPRHASSSDKAEKAASSPSSSPSLSGENGTSAPAPSPQPEGAAAAGDSTGWSFLPQRALVRHQASACIQISRTTLITMMIITNGRQVFQYSDAAGFRAGYGSYSGQWYITWPIGQEAIVRFAPHDSHSAATDVYPPSFPQRVDRCVQMVSGVVSAPASGFQVGFCGRKAPGAYTLEHAPKGFPGAHGSRHLYNMMGGKVYDVDFMFARHAAPGSGGGGGALVLDLPSTEKGQRVQMVVPDKEQDIIRQALDCLPWTSLSWSIHRGLKDILVAYGKARMDHHRKELAALLKRTVEERPLLLDARGWNPQFVRHNMGDMAASAILAGEGNSGDLVRVVTDIVLALVGDWSVSQLDEVNFWRRQDDELDLQAVVALTKLFVLEWSNEFDYQMYHDLPITLYFG